MEPATLNLHLSGFPACLTRLCSDFLRFWGPTCRFWCRQGPPGGTPKSSKKIHVGLPGPSGDIFIISGRPRGLRAPFFVHFWTFFLRFLMRRASHGGHPEDQNVPSLGALREVILELPGAVPRMTRPLLASQRWPCRSMLLSSGLTRRVVVFRTAPPVVFSIAASTS